MKSAFRFPVPLAEVLSATTFSTGMGVRKYHALQSSRALPLLCLEGDAFIFKSPFEATNAYQDGALDCLLSGLQLVSRNTTSSVTGLR
jgi:hypothetical protein